MKKVVSIKKVNIGQGVPKICVPMVGATVEELLEEAQNIKNLPCDVIEWRVDFFEKAASISFVIMVLEKIRKILPETPMIFTFRNKVEGGQLEISARDYRELNKKVMETGLVDLVDVELFREESLVRELVESGKENHAAIIISNHDFEKTPPKAEMIRRLIDAFALGGDIAKLAVMPRKATDVAALQEATLEAKERHGISPLITMSMGGLGVISRFSGEIFGSDMTFGAAGKASAPGQVEVCELKKILELIHENMSQ